MKPGFGYIRPMYIFRAFICSLLFGVVLANVHAEPLTSLPDLRAISAANVPDTAVDVTAQVVWKHPRADHLFIISDGARGVYVRCRKDLPPAVAIGDIVHITGALQAGDFSPSISAERVEIRGNLPLPTGRPFYPHELYAGSIDCDWVSFAGQVIAVQLIKTGKTRIMLELAFGGTSAYVQIPYTDYNLTQLGDIMFRRVRFSAVAGTIFNEQRQLTERLFYANSIDSFALTEPEPSTSTPPLLAIHELLRFDSGYQKRSVRTRGQVISVGERELFLRGPQSCLKVSLWQPDPDIKPGDTVEMEGLVWPQPISPSFLARHIQVLSSQPEPNPVTLELESSIPSHLNFELIEVDAQLLGMAKPLVSRAQTDDRRTLLCRSGAQTFEAVLPTGSILPAGVEPGAWLRLRGIAHLHRNQSNWTALYAHALWIQLEPIDGVKVLRTAPWWTVARVSWLTGGVLAVALLFLIWNLLLKKTVEHQTVIIGEQVKQAGIWEERQRIARELHDSVGQGLGGMMLQVRFCKRLAEQSYTRMTAALSKEALNQDEIAALQTSVDSDAEQGRQGMAQLQGMLKFCSEETRGSIQDLRGGILEQTDFVNALRSVLPPLVESCNAELKLEVSGAPKRFDLFVERHLMMVVKEAVSNAAQHAESSEISVQLSYMDNGLQVVIQDNGRGFDRDAVAKPGHFGQQGMQERMKRINGTIQIQSACGEGCRVELMIE